MTEDRAPVSFQIVFFAGNGCHVAPAAGQRPLALLLCARRVSREPMRAAWQRALALLLAP
eukprot:COSAG04_NODE_17901_length_456_cov_1.128852_1_plen_59_part_01